MENRHTGGRQNREGFRPEASDGSGIGEAKTPGARVASRHAVGLFFDTEKIRAGMEGRHANEECPAVATEINLQWSCGRFQPCAGEGCGSLRVTGYDLREHFHRSIAAG